MRPDFVELDQEKRTGNPGNLFQTNRIDTTESGEVFGKYNEQKYLELL